MEAVHVFEKAGLGKAPFRCVGNFESKYQACQGAPIQPGSMCAYCGNGIMNVFVIRSADKKEFKVGCDCVAKAGDRGLKKTVAAFKTKARHAREKARIDAAKAALETEDVQAKLSALPHPNTYLASQGKTMLDWAAFMLKAGGNKAGVEVAKLVGV